MTTTAQETYSMLGSEPIWRAAAACHEALAAAGVPHTVIGGVAVCLHGYRRNTVDVDLLVRTEDMTVIREALTAAGFRWDEQAREFRDSGGIPLQFVAAGKLTYGKEEIVRFIERNRCGDHILLPGYVPDEDLPALYSGARLFLFTTLYEGFGLPILEAVACGTPVVTSNVSAMREIASDAIFLVDPLSEEKIAEKILEVIHQGVAPRRRPAETAATVSGVTWKEMADRILAVYRGD